MNIIEKALEFATKAHEGQLRKYTNDPYINHPIAVKDLIQKYIPGMHGIVLSAALLHDVVEDNDNITIQHIEEEFGTPIAHIVEGLTEVYTSKAYPNIARKERKKLECWRIFNCNTFVHTIKLADLIDNTSSIVKYDPEFAKVYLKEKEELLSALRFGNNYLSQMAVSIITEAKKDLNL